MGKSPDAFRTISEVAEWLGIQAHVLRFWESKFSQVKPVKRAGGRRYYRPADMVLLGGIKKLLHDDGLTIKGVQKILREQGVDYVSAQSAPIDDIPAEPAPRPPRAVGFQSRMSFQPAPAQGESCGPDQPESAVAPDPEGMPEAVLPDPDDIELDTAPELAPAAPPDPDETAPAPPVIPVADTASEPEPVPSALPSFLHRPAEPDAPPVPRPAAQAPEPPAAPRPRIVEAPDPPETQDIRYVPGALGVLAGIDRLSAEQARALAPVVRDLRAVLDHLTGPDSA